MPIWKEKLLEFAEQLQHPAWGLSHSKRVCELVTQLAGGYENVDMDSIIAAAYLHDVGAFPGYKQDGVDHAERSVQVVGDILTSISFPEEKIHIVKDIIKGHMFYVDPGSRLESVLFHDADTLDFMGFIGITRLLAIVGIDDWTPDLKSAIGLIKKFQKELPNLLHTQAAKEMAACRVSEMSIYLKALSDQTNEMALV